MRALLFLSAGLCVIGFGYESPQGRAMLAPVLTSVLDRFDQRPVQRVLIIGNSRTYWHQMPAMVREIADSAASPVRFDITTLAWGGASFEENWKDASVQRALGRHWDQIVLQPESRAEADEQYHQSFATYGEKLIKAGATTGSPVALIINWGYGESLYGADASDQRQQYVERLEQAERSLARDVGAQVIDTSKVWEKVHAATPALPLYEDGNHPTAYGSYLSALMLEGFLSGGTVSGSYVPLGADKDYAAVIKSAVTDYYRS